MQITIKFGSETIQKTFPNPPTIHQIKESASIKAALCFGDNIRLTVNGVEQTDSSIVPDGAVVNIETRANTKAESK